jgi:hypothetical protein
MSAYACESAESWKQYFIDQLVAGGLTPKSARSRVNKAITFQAVRNLNAMNRIKAASGLVDAAVRYLKTPKAFKHGKAHTHTHTPAA